MSPLLLLLSRVLELVNAVAYTLHRTGVRNTFLAPVQVISVGNIAAGGAGKTPLVAALAATLEKLGQRPAILTRGYRRARRGQVLISDDRHPPWELVGDEPALLARALPNIPIVVDADRVRGAQRAVRDVNPTHLVLDDAFQHWRLARDLDIVAVDASDPLCRRSLRREHPRALARAGAIVITNAEPPMAEAAMALILRRHPGKVVVASRLRPTALVQNGERTEVFALAGRRVVAFAGIAAPRRFFATVKSLGAETVKTFTFPDHHPFRADELALVIAAAAQADALPLTTAKDIVRVLPGVAPNVAWLAVEAAPVVGTFEDLLAPVLPP